MATTLISLEEYLRTSYELDMEFVYGVLIWRNAGTRLHFRAMVEGRLPMMCG